MSISWSKLTPYDSVEEMKKIKKHCPDAGLLLRIKVSDEGSVVKFSNKFGIEPELAADLIDRGIVMAGGGSLLRGIDKRIAEETGLPVHVAEDPNTAVVRGTGETLNMPHNVRRRLMARAKLDF